MLDTRTVRKEATRARILEAAWELARRDGLAALSFREVAAAVGMRAPSLYTYFDSKNDLYDAMYAETAEMVAKVIRDGAVGSTPKDRLRSGMHAFVAFFAADPARYQLLVERPVPGFVPRPESFAVSRETFAATIATDLAALQITGERATNLWRAITTGLLTQQIANDPGGDGWTSLVDEAFDMYMTHQERKGKKR